MTDVRQIGKWIKTIFYSVVIVLVGIHFILTLLFVAPKNPLKTIKNLTNTYIKTYFYQNWNLFAPDPADMNLSISMNCVGKYSDLGWRDITTPLLQAHMNNRLSPLERVWRVPDNYAIGLFARDDSDLAMLKICSSKSKNDRSCQAVKDKDKLKRKQSVDGLVQVASAFCADMSKVSGNSFQHAQIVVNVAKIPKWSQRYMRSSKKTEINLGQHELKPSKAYGIWELQ